jgi:hypothetical protein
MKHELSLLLIHEHVFQLPGLSTYVPQKWGCSGDGMWKKYILLINKITRLLSNVQKNAILIKKPNGAAHTNPN